MALTLTTAAGILKEFYLPVVREQLNNKTVILAQLERSSDGVEGDHADLALHVSRNSGVGARGDGGALPTPGQQGSVQSKVKLRTNTAAIQLTVQTMKALASDRSSFERALDSEMKRITNDARRDVNRQIFGTSDGQIALCGTTTASTTVTLATATDARQMRQFSVGMSVDISTTALPGDQAIAAARQITAVNASGKTITISGGAVTTSGSHQVEVNGSGGSGGTLGAGALSSSLAVAQKELTGLQSIIKSGTSSNILNGVDPGTYPDWQTAAAASVASAGAPSENLFEKVMDEADIAGGESIDLFVTTHGVRRGYSSNLTTLKRFNDTTTLKGGFTGLDISSGDKTASLVVDRDCPIGFAFGMSTPHFRFAQWQDWTWMEEDGAVLSRVPGQLAYTAAMFWIADLYSDKRNASALLTGLTES